jgi:hypothetical protein
MLPRNCRQKGRSSNADLEQPSRHYSAEMSLADIFFRVGVDGPAQRNTFFLHTAAVCGASVLLSVGG